MPNGARRYVANDRPCSTPMSPVKLPTTAIRIFANSVALATPQMLMPSMPLAPKLNTEMTIAIPIQIFAKPRPPNERFTEVIGTMSSDTSVFTDVFLLESSPIFYHLLKNE